MIHTIAVLLGKFCRLLGLNSLFEYLILFYEYIRIRLRSLLYNTALCIITFCCITKFDLSIDYPKYASDMQTGLVTVLGILLGFSISTLTILLTVDNDKIRDAKCEILRVVFNRNISLYDAILSGIAYVVIIQCMLFIFNLIYPVFVDVESSCGLSMYALSIAVVLHVILIIMREMLNFYFIITKK